MVIVGRVGPSRYNRVSFASLRRYLGVRGHSAARIIERNKKSERRRRNVD
jgi:hypothetical protein